MNELLSKKQAIEYLGIDAKTFDNYFKNADEFSCIERNSNRGRFYFDKQALQAWKEDRESRTINLTIEDYALCLDFALAMHFRGYVMSDFGTARQREFGQKITNWIKGQLGEVAVKKYFKQEFDCNIELDFNIHGEIVPQDIIGIAENRKIRKPKIGVGIKSSKPKNAYLILGGNEINIPERRSDIYIYCRPDIADDHLLRIAKKQISEIVKNQLYCPGYKEKMPEFTDIPCEIVGWCKASELKEVTSIPGQTFDNGTRFVIKSGCLRRTKEQWRSLISKL
jgi:hypothetical protein